MRNTEPTDQEIEAKATELYIKDKGKPPPDEPFFETLKTTPSTHSSYWKKAREILLGEVEEENVRINSHITEREYASLLRPKEAAKALGVSRKTLWRWWKEGRISAKQLPSRRLRYPKDEIDRILQK
jgi:excisionase family DNA binding protein